MIYIWVFVDFLYAWYDILVILFELWVLFGQLDLWFLQREKCLVLGSYRAVTSPSDRRGSEARIMGFISYCMNLSLYIMSSCLRRYPVCYELNTLDACWIAVDVWSNSSRCRQESVYWSWTWCLCNDHFLDIIIIIWSSINFPKVICSPTALLFFTREAASEIYGPRVSSLSYLPSRSIIICFYFQFY